MAAELLDRVLREVRERKKRAHAAWEESRRLEAALRALEGDQTRAQPRRPTIRPQPRSSRERAPRGQTRDTVLRVVAERPDPAQPKGVSAAILDKPGASAYTTRRIDL